MRAHSWAAACTYRAGSRVGADSSSRRIALAAPAPRVPLWPVGTASVACGAAARRGGRGQLRASPSRSNAAERATPRSAPRPRPGTRRSRPRDAAGAGTRPTSRLGRHRAACEGRFGAYNVCLTGRGAGFSPFHGRTLASDGRGVGYSIGIRGGCSLCTPPGPGIPCARF
eukprot:scaffold2529_cov363-Prasinococcus_capsulatus_cf.AAC.13